MKCVDHPGAGFRRFDGAAAAAERTAQAFLGLPDGSGPGHALAAFKRAAAYLNVPPSVVQLVDVLFAWTKPEDWQAPSTPIVWPRNDKLARKLGLKVRQVQNLLNRAISLRLISHKDSPNGNRGGARGPDGKIKWAYGIVLSPIGTRIEEFRTIAERGAREDEEIDALRRRLAAARRRTAGLAQAAMDASLERTGADEELALAQSAARQMRYVRDVQLLTSCVEQIEQRGRALEACVSAALLDREEAIHPHVIDQNAPSDVDDCIDSTTTIQPLTAIAVTSSGSPRRSSEGSCEVSVVPQTAVEDDLEQHGVDPVFIESIVPELCGSLDLSHRGWGQLVHLAERLADQHHIHRHAWHEACRVMGQRGAAASVIATVRKYQAGEVDRPGAYLRGMSVRAGKGELHLGRTFHGLKDTRRAESMRAMQTGGDVRSLGQIARAVSRQLVLSGRSS